MKINLDRNFTKYVGSRAGAVRLANKIAMKYNDRVYTSTIRKIGKLVLEAWGETKNFKWKYYPEYKTITVTYTDGRPLPEEIEPKNTYFIIWVEGLSPERGEKVKHITAEGIEYTLKMTDALRVREKHLPMIKMMLGERHIANWVIDNPNSFVKTHYAPKGTLFA